MKLLGEILLFADSFFFFFLERKINLQRCVPLEASLGEFFSRESLHVSKLLILDAAKCSLRR